MSKVLCLVFLLNVFMPFAFGFCSSNESSIAKYEEVKDLPNHPEILLIDVRTPKEVEDTGRIPTSIHIPIESLLESLSPTADKEQFFQRHGREFPQLEDHLIFYCHRGGRAQKAMELACSLGFNKSRFYKGSWSDWSEKEGLNVKDLQKDQAAN